MRVLLVGATGTIGRAVAAALGERHEVIAVSRSSGAHRADIEDAASIARLYGAVGPVDAVVCTAGRGQFGPLAQLDDAAYWLAFESKLKGQVNLVRHGLRHLARGGSFTLTSGVLAQQPAPGSTSLTPANAAVEWFARAAALELGDHRINVVSPGWVSETLALMGMDPDHGTPAEVVARTYLRAVEGRMTGQVLAVEEEA
jgi:NAD(P)-dependent dehydrogenase (short-subunit alcohol dehydrogenase family)